MRQLKIKDSRNIKMLENQIKSLKGYSSFKKKIKIIKN